VDEIFALSTYNNDDEEEEDQHLSQDFSHGFTSILSLDPWIEAQCDPSRIHMM
jgi:hypothetical protein